MERGANTGVPRAGVSDSSTRSETEGKGDGRLFDGNARASCIKHAVSRRSRADVIQITITFDSCRGG
ncbi:hypothetical protein GCM10017776_06520 [Streptomyces griseoluteus]|nr:hypothetical protein GCM10017776_06520 [Streptomyces griseoluteus]